MMAFQNPVLFAFAKWCNRNHILVEQTPFHLTTTQNWCVSICPYNSNKAELLIPCDFSSDCVTAPYCFYVTDVTFYSFSDINSSFTDTECRAYIVNMGLDPVARVGTYLWSLLVSQDCFIPVDTELELQSLWRCFFSLQTATNFLLLKKKQRGWIALRWFPLLLSLPF